MDSGFVTSQFTVLWERDGGTVAQARPLLPEIHRLRAKILLVPATAPFLSLAVLPIPLGISCYLQLPLLLCLSPHIPDTDIGR